MLKADLKLLGGKHHGKLIPLLTSKFLIGREEDCQLRPSSELVSRHHCVFSVDDFCVRLRDLGSTNGTLVNGQRIRGQVELKAGDKVHIGKLDFELVIRAGVREPQSTVVVPSGAPSQPEPLESPTPAPGVAPVDADTGQLSNSETSFELPVPSSQALSDTAPNAGALSSDTTVMYLPQAPPPQQYAPQPPNPMLPPAPPMMAPMQGYPQPPGYPMPGGYPQMPYPQYGYPYPQMPPQYYPPGMPYQQPLMAPPQYELPAPEAADDDVGGNVPSPPVKLPPPETTGAQLGKAVVGSTGVVQAKPGEAPAAKPSDKAAEIIRQMSQRRPTGGGGKK